MPPPPSSEKSIRTRKTNLTPIDYPDFEEEENNRPPPTKIVVSHPLSPNPSPQNQNNKLHPSFTKMMFSGADEKWTPKMEFWWRVAFISSIIGLIICLWVIIHELTLSSSDDGSQSHLSYSSSHQTTNNHHQSSSWLQSVSEWFAPSSSMDDLRSKTERLSEISGFERAEVFRKTHQELRESQKQLEKAKLGLADFYEENFFRDRTIFVSVASFRDVKCRITVEDIFEKAVNPRRIFLGIIEQNEHGDPTCIPEKFAMNCVLMAENSRHEYDPRSNFFCPLDNVRRRRVPSVRGRGPTYGRYVSMLMYRGEGYYMMIDSHNRFKPKWDMDATKMIFLADSKKPVLSHYPLAWHQDTNFDKPQFTTVMCKAHFVSFGYVRMGGLNFVNSKRPRLQPLTAAGLIFADAAMVHEVPFDPHLDFLFDGEELLYTVRLYTHGWDSFAPSWNFVFHDYDRHTAPRFWHISSNKWGIGQVQSVKRVQWLLKIPKRGKDWNDLIVSDKEATPQIRIDSEKYGLGKSRSLESFWQFANIDLLRKVDNFGVCGKYTRKQ